MYVLFYWGGAEVARGANNSEDVGSNPTSGIYHSSGFTESATAVTTATIHRHGAGAARRAHNPEVTRSIRVVGILLKSYKHMVVYMNKTMEDEGKPIEDGRKNRIDQMRAIQAEALELFTRKNADYGDAFAKYGVIGVLMRIEDKLQRSMSITKNGVNLVADEGIRDTLIDLHNYAAMALMLLDE